MKTGATSLAFGAYDNERHELGDASPVSDALRQSTGPARRDPRSPSRRAAPTCRSPSRRSPAAEPANERRFTSPDRTDDEMECGHAMMLPWRRDPGRTPGVGNHTSSRRS
jgi:hypothetical protein